MNGITLKETLQKAMEDSQSIRIAEARKTMLKESKLQTVNEIDAHLRMVEHLASPEIKIDLINAASTGQTTFPLFKCHSQETYKHKSLGLNQYCASFVKKFSTWQGFALEYHQRREYPQYDTTHDVGSVQISWKDKT